VHRDLKPENVFLVGKNAEDLRIVDFGAAKIMGSSRITKTGIVFGTPHFMSPEQVRGDPSVDHRADIYALGVMLDAIASAPPIVAIARKAQSEDPATRYQDVRSLAADISCFLDGRAVGAHRERVVDRLARIWRRYRLPILLVATYLVVRILLLWWARI